MQFINLNVKSEYSMLASTIKIDNLVDYATTRNLDTLSIVEDGSMHSAVKFFTACSKASIRPVIGMSLIVTANKASSLWTLFARNQTGYRVLLKLASDYAILGEVPAQNILDHIGNLLVCIDASGIGHIRDLLNPNFYIGVSSVRMLEQAKGLKDLGLPFVYLPQVRTLDEDEGQVLQVLKAIKDNVNISKIEIHDDAHFLSPRAARILAETDVFLQEAMSNTTKIADACDVTIDLGRNLLPKFPVPTGDSSVDYLEALCVKGLKRRYGSELSLVHSQRLNTELSVIGKMGFSDYFLIVWDFIKYAKANGIMVGPGRGSAAGSLVSYVLGITGVDPIKYELLFERFLNPERISLPDIDIDFQDDRRDEVISYVQQKYGEFAVCHIATFGTFGTRASWRDTARVHGLETPQINALSKFLSSRARLEENSAQNPLLQNYLETHPSQKMIFNKATKLEGIPRHLSTHAAGIIISPVDLRNFTALTKGSTPVYLSQYEAGDLEAIGLLKMDFLGLRNLTMIQEISRSIRAEIDPNFNIGQIPYDDPATFDLIAKANTTGIFQLESDGMKAALRQVLPSNIEDIISVLALFRPGPMANIPMFSARKHGQEEIIYDHPSLLPILKNTYGVIVYQEQIMQIASLVAGYSLGEADILRRAISKKEAALMQAEGVKFVRQAKERGYSQKVAQKIFDLILRFADYGFNRAHAASYAMISYQMAYLKANFPQYFMTSVLITQMGNPKETAKAIKEARGLGIEVIPPSINESGKGYVTSTGQVRLGFLSIKQVGVEAAKKLVAEREKGKFTDFYDFVIRTHEVLGGKVISSLIDIGACAEFGYSAQTLHQNVKRITEHAQYGPIAGTEFVMEEAVDAIERSQLELMEIEQELLGFYLQTHPLQLFEQQISEQGWIIPSDVVATTSQRIACIGFVSRIKEIKDKNGKAMAFLELTDESEQIDLTIFAREYKLEYRNLINRVVVVSGVVNVRNDRLGINFSQLIAVLT